MKLRMILTFSILTLAAPFVGAGPAEEPTPRLVLIVASHNAKDESWIKKSIENDAGLLFQAFREKGFKPEEIMVLRGELDSRQVREFLAAAARRTSSWKSGTVIFAYSGHGGFQETDRGRVSTMNFGDQDQKGVLPWDEVFRILSLPEGVRLLVLPDS